MQRTHCTLSNQCLVTNKIYRAGFPKHFYKRPSLKKLKKLWPLQTILLKKLPLKTPKTFFCADHH